MAVDPACRLIGSGPVRHANSRSLLPRRTGRLASDARRRQVRSSQSNRYNSKPFNALNACKRLGWSGRSVCGDAMWNARAEGWARHLP